jgi:hypothetical protein
MTGTSVQFLGAAVAVSLCAMVLPARATTVLTPAALADLVQSTANSADLVLLSYLKPFPGNVHYVYSSTAVDPGWTTWSGALNGNYGGLALLLSYSNGVLNYPAGAVSWNTSGSLGAGAVTGGGSAAIAHPTETTFALTFNDSLTFGGWTATAHVVFSGTLLGPNSLMFGSPAHPGSGSDGTVTVSDPENDFWPLTQLTMDFGDGSTISASEIVVDGETVMSWDRTFPPGDQFVNEGGSVPEPATWTMLLLGFGGLGVAGRRRAVFALDRSAPPLATERRRET